MISRQRLEQLYAEYQRIVKLEVEEFGVKPTEVRHLLGRLGEFHCALHVNGTLASTPNQHGFDVLCPAGKKISVKTTAQRAGFVAISAKTSVLSQNLMVLQYVAGNLEILYFGPMDIATGNARLYAPSDCYEFDLGKARSLNTQNTFTERN